MAALPGGFVTFVFTDIAGSTRLFQRLGERYRTLLEEHRRLVRAAFDAHGGVEVRTEGDAFFAAFRTPWDGVLGCVDAQRALSNHPWPDDGVIRVRMGLHSGEAEPIDGDYVSMVVHQAARVAAAGHGGQIIVSEATRDAVEAELPAPVTLVALGEYVLKDFDGPEPLYQVLHPELPVSFPALSVMPARGHNLPIARTSFLGRDPDVRELVALVAQAPLVTITGSGGVGKTRLALEVGRGLLPSFPGGVWLVELMDVTDADSVGFALAAALGVREEPGRPLEETLVEALTSRRLAIILDNCEHVVRGVARIVDRVLAHAPNLRVLATSRQPLGVAGERVWETRPVALEAAVQLFAERASAVRRDFVANDDVVAICAAVDCLPLAVELAAARVRALSPAQILAKLSRRFALLGALRATIEWSHDLLDPVEQALFCRLAVFRGGCTLDSAEAVADADVDTVQSLVDKSLVRSDGGRLSMLESIREFAWERLVATGDAEAVAASHARHFGGMAPTLGWAARASDLDALNRIAADYDNLSSALDWAIDHGETDVCEQVIEGLWYPWVHLGLTSDGYRRARLALERSPSPPPGFVSLVGELARFCGDLEFCVEMKRRAIADYESTGAAPSRVAAAHTDVAEALVALGRFDEARTDADRGMALRTAGGDAYGIAHARAALVQLELALGENERAAELSERSIEAFRAAGTRSDLAWELLRAATAYSRMGERARPIERLQEALQVGREIGENAVLVAIVEQTAALAARAGDDEVALRLYGASRALRTTTGWAFAADDAALAISGGRVAPDRRDALLADGANAPLDTAVAWASEVLGPATGLSP